MKCLGSREVEWVEWRRKYVMMIWRYLQILSQTYLSPWDLPGSSVSNYSAPNPVIFPVPYCCFVFLLSTHRSSAHCAFYFLRCFSSVFHSWNVSSAWTGTFWPLLFTTVSTVGMTAVDMFQAYNKYSLNEWVKSRQSNSRDSTFNHYAELPLRSWRKFLKQGSFEYIYPVLIFCEV